MGGLGSAKWAPGRCPRTCDGWLCDPAGGSEPFGAQSIQLGPVGGWYSCASPSASAAEVATESQEAIRSLWGAAPEVAPSVTLEAQEKPRRRPPPPPPGESCRLKVEACRLKASVTTGSAGGRRLPSNMSWMNCPAWPSKPLSRTGTWGSCTTTIDLRLSSSSRMWTRLISARTTSATPARPITAAAAPSTVRKPDCIVERGPLSWPPASLKKMKGSRLPRGFW
mmetsp:Transcript_46200/g.119485  ORF Transcript_46200/g.119485 Transcript_46200/m.119485 type:complete len:224 (-) Transcript_46200:1196-1867(-)